MRNLLSYYTPALSMYYVAYRGVIVQSFYFEKVCWISERAVTFNEKKRDTLFCRNTEFMGTG